MTSEIKNVLVLGAGGNLGSLLVAKLQQQGFNVSVLTRSESKAVFGPELLVHRVNYDDFPSLVKAFQGQDAVISTVGTFGIAAQKTAIDAALAAHVKRFLPSEYGGDTSLSGTERFAPYAVEKRKITEYLKTKENGQLSWTSICTGPFIAWGLDLGKGALGWDIENGKVTIYDGGSRPFDASTDDRVCQAIISSLKHFEETKNTHVNVNSFTLTQNQILQVLEKLSGKEYEISYGDAAELAAIGLKHLQEGDTENGYPEVVTASVYGPWGFTYFGGRTAHWNEILGLEPEDLESVLREVLKKKNLV